VSVVVLAHQEVPILERGLDCRIAQLSGCLTTYCAAPGAKHTALLFADVEKTPRRWFLALSYHGTSADAVEALSQLSDEELENVLRLSILYGVLWDAFAATPERVFLHQHQAAIDTPPRYMREAVEDVRFTRAMINDTHPVSISHLLAMAESWSHDVGGTKGATPA
jgi:hypothetical protein